MVFRIILIYFLSIVSFAIDAKCRTAVKARYTTQSGWSKVYSVEATFVSGKELNEATKSFDYDSFKIYAVIFWGKGQATIIELETSLFCSYEVTCHCLKNFLYDDFTGTDQDGDSWEVCVEDQRYISNCF